MTTAFRATATASGTELRLESDGQSVPFAEWGLATGRLSMAIDLIRELIADGKGDADNDLAILGDEATAELSAQQAQLLNLPPPSDASAHITTSGLLTRPDFTVTLQWRNPLGQPIVGARRVGAFLVAGGQPRRLLPALFQIAREVDRYHEAVAGHDEAARAGALSRLQEALPAAPAGAATLGGLLKTLTIRQADAFSLDLVGEGESAKLLPVLHRAGSSEPVLDAEQQRAFAEDQFHRFAEARPIYTLPGGVFVAIPPVLRRCLSVVRATQSRPAATRRALLANPRAQLRVALESTDDPTLLDRLDDAFVETHAWSDRVIGLGLWTPRVVPWIADAATDWFGTEPQAGAPEPKRGDGLLIGGRPLPLSAEQAETLRARVEDARGKGEEAVAWQDASGERFQVPATAETQAALTELADSRARAAARDSRAKPEHDEREILLIHTNEETIGHQANFQPRAAIAQGMPIALSTRPKPHQHEGIAWLQHSWLAGRPGVLLADDMGLGKTLQALSFLCWLRAAMVSGGAPRGPILIVAPTGLLANWLAEHERHLVPPGLGKCLAAYGAGLKALRPANGAPGSLDRAKLSAADWVLTTYETLRDHDQDFGAVRFAALLCDEAQKVKTPGARMTDAVKAMHADFRIAMTGTPVENRLSDLWCIVDGVHSGVLQDLGHFSRTYESAGQTPALANLRAQLDQPMGGAPPLMLRRLRADQLADLPQAAPRPARIVMPPTQRREYARVIEALRSEAPSKGAVLGALQRLRAVALHPDPGMAGDDAAFIAASARTIGCFRALEEAHAANEAALVVLYDLAMQAKLAGLIQRRFRLARPVPIINGEVAGGRRQAIVDGFQAGTGFGVVILSPQAGGVGLTLTRANHVIHVARWWNPAVEDQCTGRALRIGQTRAVQVHLPLCVLAEAEQPDGPRAFDENLHALLQRKRQLSAQVLLPPGLTGADQADLLKDTLGG